jgi:hypothetical protein
MNVDAKILNKNRLAYKKDHTPWLSRFHPRDAGMVQHMKIIKCDTAY